MKPGDGVFPWVQLRYIARTGTGHTPSRSRPELWAPGECTIPWFTLADVWQIRDGATLVVQETAEHVSEVGLANSAAVKHPAGTVLLSRTASVGFSAVMGVDMAVSQDFMTWTPGPRLDSRFALFAIRGLKHELERLMYGSTHKTIYMPDLLALSIPLPPMVRQQEIAAFLVQETARLWGLLDALARLEAKLDEARQAVTDEVVWGSSAKTFSLGRAGCRCVTGPFGTVLSADEYVEGGVPLVNPSHIRDGHIVPSPHESVPLATAERLGRYRLRRGDLVVGRKGDLGRSALVRSEEEGWLCGSDSIALRSNLDRVSPEFVAALMDSSRVRHGLMSRSSGATLANMNERSLLAVELPILSLQEQDDRVRRLRSELARFDAQRERLAEMRDALREYSDALIMESVTGRLEPPSVAATDSAASRSEALQSLVA